MNKMSREILKGTKFRAKLEFAFSNPVLAVCCRRSFISLCVGVSLLCVHWPMSVSISDLTLTEPSEPGKKKYTNGIPGP